MKKLMVVFGILIGTTVLAAPKYDLVGDYDGDGKNDIVAFEQHPYDGNWHILKSSKNFTEQWSFYWGAENDIPVAIDFDGDKINDPTIYRLSTRTYWILLSYCHFTCYTLKKLPEAL